MPTPPPNRRQLQRRLAAVGAAAVLLAAAPAAAHAEGWIAGPAFEVAEEAQAADVAAAPDGSAVAAWISQDEDGRARATFQFASASGALSPATVLGPLGDLHADDAALDVAAGPAGGFAVVWTTREGPDDLPAAQLTQIGADGARGTTVEVATGLAGSPAVALDADGDATVAWAGLDDGFIIATAMARRIGADGVPGPQMRLGQTYFNELRVATTPGGVAWVTWIGDVNRVARINAAGDHDGTADVPSDDPGNQPDVTAGSGGGVMTWKEWTSPEETRVSGVRLPESGSLLGAPFAVDAGIDAPTSELYDVTIEDGGTVMVAWTGSGESGVVSWFSRFAPAAETAERQLLGASPGIGESLPRLALRRGSRTLAVTVHLGRSAIGRVLARTIGADGTVSGPVDTGGLLSPLALYHDRAVQLFPVGNDALLGQIEPGPDGSVITTRVLDTTAPRLDATIPATATAGQPVAFAATATDLRTDTTVSWDFGDDSGSSRARVDHAYAVPGTYTVTVTATDAADNATTVTRQVTVTAPPAPEPGPGPDPSDRPRSRRTAARLQLTRAVRSGRTVTLTGRVSARATGEVRLIYRQLVGRAITATNTRARISRGRFRATLRLPARLARRYGHKPTITARYAGNARTARAAFTRTVTTKRMPAKRSTARRAR
ncbi:PKD domain-containing protein [Conexibacter arvalis]|uniref:PKD domain-containing protein n=1 Tax=Conexibacter arvalis TaxID=912552 RepID=A0A840I6I1_9ACTN|nr:PKD domain-containing protein [Conexibacter arvalis]MBB4660536.1 hypothetical protein [Conexibacter arvalis]